ncbi:tetratricopeptide repeat protein [Flavobacterium sp.]|jgi:tetratricopeptide (TPR) repeat protein|uniref:tetratricopeptide repeat protein n=1 Tax=Flavobacterium sp. TaxID=239 RepID=UPI0037C1581D
MKILSVFIFIISMSTMANSDFEKAEQLFRQNKLVEAKALFEKHLKANPNHTKSLEYLGDIAGKNKNWDEAIGYYKKIKIQYPLNADYHYKYGGALGMKAKEINKFKALNLLGDVEESFLTAAKLDPKHIDTRWALVVFFTELPGIVGGSETKAQKYADELMKLSKVDGFMAKGYIDEYFKRYTKAEINYKKAHEIGNSKTTFQKLYDLYKNKMKQSQKAEELKKKFEK